MVSRLWQYCRQQVRVALTSVAIGSLLSTIYAFGRSEAEPLAYLLMGAIVGLCIYATTTMLQAVFSRRVRALREPFQGVAYGLLLFLGGVSGWLLGFVIASLVFGGPIRFGVLSGPPRMFLLMTALIVLVTGLIFRSWDALKERLRTREWAEKELELARSIQSRLLPPALVEGDGFTVASRNLAAHYVAGDFYDVVRLDDGSVIVAVADVAGKGVAASLIMASVKAVLPFVAKDGVTIAMSALNRKLVAELGKREFVALTLARFTPSTGALELANAGMPDAYVLRDDGVQTLVAPGVRLPLGVRADIAYETANTTLARGERMLFVSDGIPEAPRTNAEPLGYEALLAILANMPATRGEAWLDELLARVRASVREGLEDDWTAVVLERP